MNSQIPDHALHAKLSRESAINHRNKAELARKAGNLTEAAYREQLAQYDDQNAAQAENSMEEDR